MTETPTEYTASPRFTALSKALAGAQKALEGAQEFSEALRPYHDDHEADPDLYALYHMIAPSHIRQARARVVFLLHRGES